MPEARVDRRGKRQDAVLLDVLDAVDRNPDVTQRSIAVELGIALGLANTYVRHCARKGLIKVSRVPRGRYAYYLTPRGFAEKSRLAAEYLLRSLSFFRVARDQCAEIFAEAARRQQECIVLIGDGDLAEIARLIARESRVKIVGVIPPRSEARMLKAATAEFGTVNAVVITTLIDPRQTLEAAVAAFGKDSVYMPALLVRSHAGAGQRRRASS